MKLCYFLFLLIPLQTFGQWNYDNQNVIYSNNGKVGIGIGSAEPNANLQIGTATENGLINFGGYCFIGSLRSSGDFFAGKNAYAEYSSSLENSKIKVYQSSELGFSAMHMGNNGDINFYVKSGSVTANQQINVPSYNAFKITGGGFVGIGTSSPQGYLHVNPSRPVIIKNNGGQGIYGSEIGFNSVLNTSVSPNMFRKLGGTSQPGAANIAVDYYGNMFFQMFDGGGEAEVVTEYNPQISFLNNGDVGIGTTDTKGYKLAIAGKTIAEEVVVKLEASWPDYVFYNDYKLSPLAELEQFITANGHLPEVPTGGDIKENGLSLGQMNAILLKKVEELTLYVIELEKKNTETMRLMHEIRRDLLSVKINDEVKQKWDEIPEQRLSAYPLDLEVKSTSTHIGQIDPFLFETAVKPHVSYSFGGVDAVMRGGTEYYHGQGNGYCWDSPLPCMSFYYYEYLHDLGYTLERKGRGEFVLEPRRLETKK